MGIITNRRRVMTQNEPEIPLTFTAVEDGTFSYTKDCEYSLDGSSWVPLPANTQSPVVLASNKIMWRGNISPCGTFSSTGVFDVSGNVTSIKNKRFGNDKSLVSNQYASLFRNSKVRDASLLILPATTLVYNGYYLMFNGCSNLTSAPALPAVNLAPACYSSMFAKCSALVKAPDLPALVGYTNCYYGMFSQCTKLTYLKCLLADPNSNMTNNWMYLVNTQGTFVKNPSATWSRGNVGVPNNWTITDSE